MKKTLAFAFSIAISLVVTQSAPGVCQQLQAAIGAYQTDQQLVLQVAQVSDLNTQTKITLHHPNHGNYMFGFHEDEEIGHRMLARIAKHWHEGTRSSRGPLLFFDLLFHFRPSIFQGHRAVEDQLAGL
jgi:hypothetical protein